MGYEEAKEKTLEICLYKMGYGGKSSEKTGPNLLKNGMLETCQVPKVGLLELSTPVLMHSTVPVCMQGLTGNVPGVCQGNTIRQHMRGTQNV